MKDEYGIDNASITILKKALEISGVKRDGKYIGVDFTTRAEVVSYEWTLGFISAGNQALALNEDKELAEAIAGMEAYVKAGETEKGLLLYADTNKFMSTGHGWIILPGMESLASSAWNIYEELDVNVSPFDMYIMDNGVMVNLYTGEEINLPAKVKLEGERKGNKLEAGVGAESARSGIIIDVLNSQHYRGGNWASAVFTEAAGKTVESGNIIRIKYSKDSKLSTGKELNILVRVVYTNGKIDYLTNNKEVAESRKAIILENSEEGYLEGVLMTGGQIEEIAVDYGESSALYSDGKLNSDNDGDPMFNGMTVSAMTMEKTIDDYAKEHPFVKKLYANEKTKWLAVAIVSLSLGKLGAVRAEMDVMAAAIMSKVGGDEKALREFVNAHPERSRESVAKGMERMAKAVSGLMPSDMSGVLSGPRMGLIKVSIAIMHWFHNLSGAIVNIPAIMHLASMFRKKTGKEMQVNYQQVSNERTLNEAIEKFGSATADSQGNVYTNIYFMGMPENPENMGLQNMGWTVDSEFVWGSTKNGALVIFSNAPSENVISEFNNNISNKGSIKSSTATVKRVKDLSREIDITTNFDRLVPGIIIDHNAINNAGKYNENGSLVVSSDILGETKDSIANTLSDLAEIRKVEANATAKETYVYIDSADINMFKAYLGAFTSIGNNQMIIDFGVFKDLSDKQIIEILTLAKNNGISINIKVSGEDIEKFPKNHFRELGFASFIIEVNGKMQKYDYFSSRTTEIDLIEGYKNEKELVERIRKSDKNTAIRITELESLVTGGVRSIVDRVAILETFKSAILKLRSQKVMTVEYARNAAYSWDINKLPTLPMNNAQLLNAIRVNNTDLALAELGLAGNNAISLYLNQMANSIEDAAKLKEIQAEFIQAVVERVLANNALKENGMDDGLANEDFEIILGQKLLNRLQNNTDSQGVPDAVRTFIDNEEGTFNNLNNMILEQSAINTPKSVNAAIELILLSERKIKEIRVEKTMSFDVSSINAILAAA